MARSLSIYKHVEELNAKRALDYILESLTVDSIPFAQYYWNDFWKENRLEYQMLWMKYSYLFPEGTCLGLISLDLNAAKSNSIGAAS